MGRIVVANHVTLDGVYQAPGRADEDPRGGFAHGGWARVRDDPAMGQAIGALMGGPPTFLFGRRSYEIMHESWSGDDAFSRSFAQAPKFVVSRTLSEPLAWAGTTLLDGLEPVAALREREDATFTVFGSGELIEALAAAGLVDEYLLMIHPLVLGSGRRLFDAGQMRALTLVSSTATETGVLIARYAAGDPPAVSATG